MGDEHLLEKTNFIKGVISIFGGISAFLFGGFDTLFIILTSLVILDFLSGILSAIVQKKLSSNLCFKGITKKIFIFILLSSCFLIQKLSGDILPLREIIITFFAINEALSILENSAMLGIPFPSKIKEILLQIKETAETFDPYKTKR